MAAVAVVGDGDRYIPACKYPSSFSIRNALPTRFVSLAGKVISDESGEQRGLLKSLGTIFKEYVHNNELSAACFNADGLLKILVNAGSFEKIRNNEFKGTVDKIKTYCNVYYLFEKIITVGHKFKAHTYVKIITPLAWTTLAMDIILAFVEAGESAIKIGGFRGAQFREWFHLCDKVTQTETREGLAADVKQDKVQKWKIRQYAHALNGVKHCFNIAFQISLVVMFIFLASPLIGLPLGVGAGVSCCVVAGLGLSKLAVKVAALTVLDGLKKERQERKGTNTPLEFSWKRDIPSRVAHAAIAA